jgi:hypothetical protein
MALSLFGPSDHTSDASSWEGFEFRSQKKLETIEGVLLDEALSLQGQNSPKKLAEKNGGKFTRAQSGIVLTSDSRGHASLRSDLSPATNSLSNITTATHHTENLTWHVKYTQNIPGNSKGSFYDVSQFSKATDSE